MIVWFCFLLMVFEVYKEPSYDRNDLALLYRTGVFLV